MIDVETVDPAGQGFPGLEASSRNGVILKPSAAMLAPVTSQVLANLRRPSRACGRVVEVVVVSFASDVSESYVVVVTVVLV